ncbi:MAG: type II toxin-antitoxin system RelE/ParE family toxin [Euzebyales bacterium]|nr:type II toxin-antitoxin system RelE/ParE family toxin [Euzebyales bacterium]MDQ3431163.1 type II toxin-antitoxin system RelE/ParE family toxin [Actinomycetota bacterium]
MNQGPYRVQLLGPARRAVAERLPEAVAAAVLEFCGSALADDPHRVGKPLFGPLAGCHGARRSTYRVVYRIDDEQRIVHVLDVAHRRDVYRPR